MRRAASWPFEPFETFDQTIELFTVSEKGICNKGIYEGRIIVEILVIGGYPTSKLVISQDLSLVFYSSYKIRWRYQLKSWAN